MNRKEHPLQSQIKALVVTVEYSGHDATARLDSLWDTTEGAQGRVDELNKLNEEFGDELNIVVDFCDVEGKVVVEV